MGLYDCHLLMWVHEVQRMGEETCKVVNFQLSWQTNGQFYMMNCLSGSDFRYGVLVAMFSYCVVGQQPLSLMYQRTLVYLPSVNVQKTWHVNL